MRLVSSQPFFRALQRDRGDERIARRRRRERTRREERREEEQRGERGSDSQVTVAIAEGPDLGVGANEEAAALAVVPAVVLALVLGVGEARLDGLWDAEGLWKKKFLCEGLF